MNAYGSSGHGFAACGTPSGRPPRPEAEYAFRIEKDELGIRPIWHQKADRVLAYILVCFLAYVLWKALAQWMRLAGLGDAPRTLVPEFGKIKSGDVVLPAQRADGDRRTIRLCRVTTPAG